MAINKVVYGNTTLIDITNDTVASEKMLQGITAHSADGSLVTGTIPTKAAQTYTPSTTDQVITSGQYLGGVQTIAGDANLVAENIAKGVTIFGITGTHEGSGSTTSALILGGKNEVITYFGTASGTVTLDETGSGFVTLPNGTYSFTGSISGYTKRNVVVDQESAEIDVWPGTALYWYGRQNVLFGHSGSMADGYPQYADNYVKLYRNLSQYAGTFFHTSAIDLTDYTSLHAIGYRTGNTALGGPVVSTEPSFTYSTRKRVLAETVYTQNTQDEKVLDLTNITGNNYVGIGTYTYNSVNGVTDYTYAIWLE